MGQIFMFYSGTIEKNLYQLVWVSSLYFAHPFLLSNMPHFLSFLAFSTFLFWIITLIIFAYSTSRANLSENLRKCPSRFHLLDTMSEFILQHPCACFSFTELLSNWAKYSYMLGSHKNDLLISWFDHQHIYLFILSLHLQCRTSPHFLSSTVSSSFYSLLFVVSNTAWLAVGKYLGCFSHQSKVFFF